MAVRSSAAALVARVRVLINDPPALNQQFDDQTIQDVLDEGRQDVVNQVLIAKPTYSGTTISFLDYYSDFGGWESDYVIKQYLVNPVTPSLSEEIAGHFQFATTTLPPLYLTGKLHDVYRAAADLLERLSARWMLSYNVSVDGQSLQRSQAFTATQDLANSYRRKQRPHVIKTIRSDLQSVDQSLGLRGTEIDYLASGDGR